MNLLLDFLKFYLYFVFLLLPIWRIQPDNSKTKIFINCESVKYYAL